MPFSEDISVENRCFGFLHVRLATVLIGFWQILVNFFIVSIFIYLLFVNADLSDLTKTRIDEMINVVSLGQRRDFIFNMREKYVFFKNPKDVVVSHDNHNVTMEVASKVLPISNSLQDYYVAFSISVFTISFCVMLIIGTIKRKPPHLMPYFCVEVFYFVVNSLTLISEFSGMPLRNEYDKQNGHTSYFKWINSNVSRRHNIASFIQGLLLLSFNLYVLNIIWSCYKFLLRVSKGLELDRGFSISADFFTSPPIIFKWRRLLLLRRSRNLRNEPASDMDNVSLLNGDCERNENSNQTLEEIEAETGLPKYEELLLLPANEHMPPPYYSILDRTRSKE